MPKVCLAISAYRSDAAVLDLLDRAKTLIPRVFDHAIVVDSLGSGEIPRAIEERGYTWATYHGADVNLGSAGNLARRLSLAAASGADYVYALNHDGTISEATVSALVAAAERVERIGAAYPLRVLSTRGGRYDVTALSRLLLPTRTSATPPQEPFVDVYWGSSNGTLYALAPVREGLTPWADLWMGNEDLGYGWLLHQHGYRQVIVRDAVFEDAYEFRRVSTVAGRSVHVVDKAPWYAYYWVRNLILISRRLPLDWDVQTSVATRIALEWGTTALLRRNKRERLKLMTRGLLDGLRNRSGKYD